MRQRSGLSLLLQQTHRSDDGRDCAHFMQQRRDFSHTMAASSKHNDDAYPEDLGKLDYTFGANRRLRFRESFAAISQDDLRKAYDRDTLLMYKRICITGRSSLSCQTDNDVTTYGQSIAHDPAQPSRNNGYSEEHDTFPEEGIFVLEL